MTWTYSLLTHNNIGILVHIESTLANIQRFIALITVFNYITTMNGSVFFN